MPLALHPASTLPLDWDAGTLIGRVWRPDLDGPSVVVAREGALHDISSVTPTVRDLCENADPVALARSIPGELVGSIGDVLANTPRHVRDRTRPWLLAPVDLQTI
jgi:fumarylacetoacetate (FAA) hydrolase family protein